MSIDIKVPKKLIEVALPLDDINKEAVREKSIRHGHPSTLHLWWARRPLAAARAVLFAQLVNDPGYERHLGRGLNKERADKERERLFGIIRKLVVWENSNNEEILNEAKEEIKKSWIETCELNKNHPQAPSLFNPDKLPDFHDPFAGGGAIPLEAQRLGLEPYATDLNPVAVLINKAMIEIPPKFRNRSPVFPDNDLQKNLLVNKNWPGAKGLAEDFKRYGLKLKNEAFRQIGQYYPEIEITKEMAKDREDLKPLVGQNLRGIAWLWVHTILSPNPRFSHLYVPLASTFTLSSKPKKEAYIEPVIKNENFELKVRIGVPNKKNETASGTKLARGANFKCLLSGTPIDQKYVRDQFKKKKTGIKLMAVVVEGPHGRIYLSGSKEIENIAFSAIPDWKPEIEMNQDCKDLLSGRGYGFKYWYELFSQRQLLALNTFSKLIIETHKEIKEDAINAGYADDKIGLDSGGTGASAYADAISLYLSFVLDKVADYWSAICSWHTSGEKMRNTFGRQAIPMVWDYAEANPFCDSTGNWMAMVDWVWKSLERVPAWPKGTVYQADAQTQNFSKNKVISTDPPYYDNIGYADLSDFFYIWLRHTLKTTFPNLLSTISVPKTEELIAASYRHGGKREAEKFFLEGMKRAMKQLSFQAHPAFPVTIYYAFKQAETKEEETASTGWETFLEAVLGAGFTLTGTWPMRTELGNRMIGVGTNALASSIVLVCQKRNTNAVSISRRDFVRELNIALPIALEEMTQGGVNSPVAPVDLSQAIIGPGMAIFSKYSSVIEADGKPMTVKTALHLINRFIAEDDFDHDTQFCVKWFDQYGWNKGKFGDAEVLARAKGTSVDGLRESEVIESFGGSLRLFKWSELPDNWKPEKDNKISVWEILHHLIRVYNIHGETEAGKIISKVDKYSDLIRTLAYRLYTICERKKWPEEALVYNNLILAWDAIESAAQEIGYSGTQISLFGDIEGQPKKEDKKNKKRKRK